MNTSKRLIFGVLSSLLLAVGFVRAADRLDPMSQSVRGVVHSSLTDDPAPPCGLPCDEGGGGGEP